jgi:hypothetical protein
MNLKSSSFLQGDSLRLHDKVNRPSLLGINKCLIWQSYEPYNYIMWAGGILSNYSDLNVKKVSFSSTWDKDS